MIRLACAAALIGCTIAGPSTGQGDPLYLIAGNVLLAATRSASGTLVTLQTLSPVVAFRAMTPGPGDDTIYAMGAYNPMNSFDLVQAGPRGVTTLARYAPFGTSYVEAMDMDDAGDLRYLIRGTTTNGLYTSPIGGPVLRTVPWPAGVTRPAAFIEDPESGDFIVLTYWGSVHRIDRAGTAVSLTQLSGAVGGDVDVDVLTGDILIGTVSTIHRLSRSTQTLTTMFVAPKNNLQFAGLIASLAFDPPTRGYLVSGWHVCGHCTTGWYAVLDAQGNTVFYSGSGPILTSYDIIEPQYARVFTPRSAPGLGTTYRVAFHARGEAGQRYQAGVALSTRPGIQTPVGTIPVAFDPMLLLSVSGLPIFRNLGGRLSAAGRATIEIDVQPIPQTRALRMHLAAITFDARGIRAIYGPHSFSLR